MTLALLAAICLAQTPPAAGPVIDRIEARVEQLRDSLDKHSAESKAWRDRWDIVDRHPDGGKLFDGHRVAAFFAWLAKGLQAVWLILVGIYKITWGLIAAIIALCVARVIRELSDAYTVWKVGKA
jgi:hypothetical protein